MMPSASICCELNQREECRESKCLPVEKISQEKDIDIRSAVRIAAGADSALFFDGILYR